MTKDSRRNTPGEILLFWPNIIGYARLAIFLLGCVILALQNKVGIFLALYGLAALLDAFDGYLARRFNQVSLYGSWLDVVIDNIQRGFLWARISQWGSFVSAIEWLTFLATRTYGPEWKRNTGSEGEPWIVRKISEKGYKTPLGHFVLISVHVLPMWILCWQDDIFTLHNSIWMSVTLFLSLGRIGALLVESWLVMIHASALLDN